MCFGGKSNASEELQAAEARRSTAIRSGSSRIQSVFSKFNPSFYEGVRQNTVDSLLPQANQQYQQARRGLGFNLAGRGLLKSSFGRQAGTELQASAETARQSVLNQGSEAVRDVKRQVQSEQANLTNQLVTSQDPNLAAQQSITAASSISAPSPIAPLGNLFLNFAQTYLGYKTAQAYAPSDNSLPSYGRQEFGTNRVNK